VVPVALQRSTYGAELHIFLGSRLRGASSEYELPQQRVSCPNPSEIEMTHSAGRAEQITVGKYKSVSTHWIAGLRRLRRFTSYDVHDRGLQLGGYVWYVTTITFSQSSRLDPFMKCRSSDTCVVKGSPDRRSCTNARLWIPVSRITRRFRCTASQQARCK
jgi:hypothetical protein